MLYQVETKLRKADEQYEAHVDATLKKRITRLEAENGVESDTAVQSAKATSDQNDVEKKAEHAKVDGMWHPRASSWRTSMVQD